ncbi:MAG: hypothetical protein ACE5Z5_09150 [Candidatus Bathyarchaeia archaeon]
MKTVVCKFGDEEHILHCRGKYFQYVICPLLRMSLGGGIHGRVSIQECETNKCGNYLKTVGIEA